MMRRVLKEADRAGRTLEIVPPSAIPALLPRFRRISDEWLAERRGREKGFPLGRFDEAYLRRFPAAVIRAPDAARISRIVAFANLWCGAPGGEVSPDLMRRSADAPRCVMDLLFMRLLQWAVEAGYSRVNLGMAPLAGLSGDPRSPAHLTPFWHRAGSFIYGRGEPCYHFRGLRAYQSKFSPVWEPRYLACPNGIVLPRVLANVATLIAGGGDRNHPEMTATAKQVADVMAPCFAVRADSLTGYGFFAAGFLCAPLRDACFALVLSFAIAILLALSRAIADFAFVVGVCAIDESRLAALAAGLGGCVRVAAGCCAPAAPANATSAVITRNR